MAAGQILPEETPLQAPEGASPSASETPAGTPAQTPDLSGYVSLQSGDESPVVAQIQVRLSELYYLDSDEPTETFGSAHEDALKRFQRTNHMKETGVADPLTQQLLFSESAKPYILENGYSGADVQSLQYRLAELGYYCDKTNGYFGVATARALSAFQTKTGSQRMAGPILIHATCCIRRMPVLRSIRPLPPRRVPRKHRNRQKRQSQPLLLRRSLPVRQNPLQAPRPPQRKTPGGAPMATPKRLRRLPRSAQLPPRRASRRRGAAFPLSLKRLLHSRASRMCWAPKARIRTTVPALYIIPCALPA